MIIDEKGRAKIRAIAAVLEAVPDGEHVYINDGTLHLSASDQAELRKYRGFFRGTFWKKRWEQWCNLWLYSTTISGVDILISCSEKPPTCEKVVTKKIVKKQVPTGFEEREVEEEEVSWNCGAETDPSMEPQQAEMGPGSDG